MFVAFVTEALVDGESCSDRRENMVGQVGGVKCRGLCGAFHSILRLNNEEGACKEGLDYERREPFCFSCVVS